MAVVTWNRAKTNVDPRRGQLLPLGLCDHAQFPRIHPERFLLRLAHCDLQPIPVLQTPYQHTRKPGQPLACEIRAAGKIQIFAQADRPVARRQAGAPDEGQPPQ